MTPAEMLFTARSEAEGGHFPADERYAELLEHVAAHGVMTAIDVETSRQGARRAIELAHERGVQVWGSHHNFDETPSLERMVSILDGAFEAGADVAKLAVMPQDANDVARLMSATWQASDGGNRPVATMAMGELGVTSRLFGHQFGSRYTFAAVGKSSAPGQIPLSGLLAAHELFSSWGNAEHEEHHA